MDDGRKIASKTSEQTFYLTGEKIYKIFISDLWHLSRRHIHDDALLVEET